MGATAGTRTPWARPWRSVFDMKPLIYSVLSLVWLLPVLHGATITGLVEAKGKEETSGDGGGGKYDSRKFKFVERVNYAEMRDFVVYLEGLAPSPSASNRVQSVVTRKVAQKGAVFLPAVLPVSVGTTVEWPNNDEIFHNVFSISEAKPFDLGLYKDPDVKRVTFDKAGRVDVFCSIHTRMNCVVLVLESEHFAVTDARGIYSIPGVPSGTYKLKAWHPRLPTQTKEIIVPTSGTLKIDFTLGMADLPKY